MKKLLNRAAWMTLFILMASYPADRLAWVLAMLAAGLACYLTDVGEAPAKKKEPPRRSNTGTTQAEKV